MKNTLGAGRFRGRFVRIIALLTSVHMSSACLDILNYGVQRSFASIQLESWVSSTMQSGLKKAHIKGQLSLT
jgi:hypothetical protein